MKIDVNGSSHDTSARTLAQLIEELDFGEAKVATALNGEFVRAAARSGKVLSEGDSVEIVSPRQGG